MTKAKLKTQQRACIFLWLLLFLAIAGRNSLADTDPKYYAVEVSATVQALPARILLSWPADANATGYIVSRKSVAAASWNSIATLPGAATSYSDANVANGSAYEYQLSKTTSIGYQGFGYIYAGINAPLTESRGKIVLVVDNTHASDLAFELNRLQQDLVGDGWTVLRHDVSRSDSVPSVKGQIQADYNADPGSVKAVFLFGHVPVPYSGEMNPDGHSDHRGAWPADVYYGDMDGAWTDATVYDTSAQRDANHNVPGDGKFDQGTLPSDAEIPVGRVDLYNMTCYSNKAFSRSELDLLRQYLNKDHNFRHGLLNVERRGLVCDNFGEKGGEAFAASGWRNFAPFFGAANNVAVPGWTYFSTLNSAGYLWSYGTGGGALYSCDGIGTSDSFATNDIKSVFTMFLGSYFGDWDNESNFLRAPLGSSTYCLTTSWAGRPHWFYHHMGLGETIGYSTLISQNNSGIYQPLNQGTRGVHVALLGDPALRMHPVAPVSNLSANVTAGVALLSWAPSTDTGIVGYHVYRSSSPSGPFTRLNAVLLPTTSFTDLTGSSSSTYMVRAIKLEQSGSGTYFNASQGIFYPNAGGGQTIATPKAPSNLAARGNSSFRIDLTWTDNSDNETSFILQRSTGTTGSFSPIATLPANSTSYSDGSLQSQTTYSYRLCAMNNSGASAFTAPATATTTAPVTTPAAASFVRVDSTTKGNWKGTYGSEGWNVIGDTERYPGYVQVAPVGELFFSWNDATADGRALQYSSKDGHLAECWYSPTTFTIDVNFLDAQTHQFALYCLDWDRNGRVQTIQISDATTGTVLDSESVSGFQEGQYLIWRGKGHIRLTLTHLVGFNAVTSGLFFDPAPVTTAPPLGGIIANGQFQLRIIGQPGQVYQILSSSDLVRWSQIDTVTLSTNTLNYSDPASSGSSSRFYRAVLAQ